MKVLLPIVLIILTTACSEPPAQQTKAKEPPKPAEPITGRQAFQMTFPAARGWAADCEPLTIRSVRIPKVESAEGKFGAWEITYVSPSFRAARVYTWSAAEVGEDLHKGVFGEQQQSWSGGGQQKPFDASALQTDTSAALETATASAKNYLGQPGTKPPVNFMLDFTPRFPEPVWRVMWGNSVSSAEYSVFVDATTGKVVGKG
jgi:hypothetical protein